LVKAVKIPAPQAFFGSYSVDDRERRKRADFMLEVLKHLFASGGFNPSWALLSLEASLGVAACHV
jgi:hypothetical protein